MTGGGLLRPLSGCYVLEVAKEVVLTFLVIYLVACECINFWLYLYNFIYTS